MAKALVIAKLIWLVSGLRVEGYAEGVGAYYHEASLRGVCELRVSEGWNDLDCSWPCLVSAIEPEDIGQIWLLYHPSCSWHLCHTVDCGAERDLASLRERGEVVETSGAMART